MPDKLRRLSGGEVIRILEGFGFAVRSTKGSHVKLQRASADGSRQTLVVPRHRDLDTGTLHAIFRQAARFVPENDLRAVFFTAEQ